MGYTGHRAIQVWLKHSTRVVVSIAVLTLVTPKLASAASDLGAAKAFAVLSGGSDVSLKNRVNIGQASASGSVTCPGAVGCPGSISGSTILMGPGQRLSS
jgi:hypothetical protein